MTSKILPFALIAITAAIATGLSGPAAGLPAAEQPGASIYRQRCQTCHGAPGQRGVLAPSLVGVVGRRAGSMPFNYSAALKQSAIVWDRARLDAFIAAPARVVPGTRMVIAVGNPKERSDLVNYLAGLR